MTQTFRKHSTVEHRNYGRCTIEKIKVKDGNIVYLVRLGTTPKGMTSRLIEVFQHQLK